MNETNLPPEGWTEPDAYGKVSFVQHGDTALVTPPKREGYVAYWIGRNGHRYTRWTYKPVSA